MNSTAQPKLLLSANEAAKALSISTSGLWNLSHPRGPIPVCKLGHRRLYRISDLEAAIAKMTRGQEGES